MANTNLFKSAVSSKKIAKAVNNAGGKAYSFSAEQELAQMAVTGTFNSTFYVSGKAQLEKVKSLVSKCSPLFLAQLAVYSRTKGYMKDMPAYLLAELSTQDVSLFKKAFPLVIDNAKMLRNFVQIMRSGEVGRTSLGSAPKNMVKRWLENASTQSLVNGSIGNSPSLADVIKLSHPKAKDTEQEALFGWILGGKENKDNLPKLVKDLISFRAGESHEMPSVSFELLTSCKLNQENWRTIAENATWTQTRMNLNTFERHGVFASTYSLTMVANRLKDKELITKAKVMPYQILSTYINWEGSQGPIYKALEQAAQLATVNVKSLNKSVAVLVDTSGSMRDPVTGNRGSASSKVTCQMVAALVASVMLYQNEDCEVVPFDTQVRSLRLNPVDSILTNARRLGEFRGGGTDCSCALKYLNDNNSTKQVVIYVSDNESWADSQRLRSTKTMAEWEKYKKRNPHAKLICIDITPNSTTQAASRTDILNVGGFSDEVFNVIDRFVNTPSNSDFWVNEIKKIQIN